MLGIENIQILETKKHKSSLIPCSVTFNYIEYSLTVLMNPVIHVVLKLCLQNFWILIEEHRFSIRIKKFDITKSYIISDC